MRSSKEIAEPATQWIFSRDPRAEITRRACAACGSSEAKPFGEKRGFAVVSCRRCLSVYTPYSPWYSSEFYYSTYYKAESLSPPAFVQTRLEEITAGFARYRQTN